MDSRSPRQGENRLDSGKKKILPKGWRYAEEGDSILLEELERKIFSDSAWSERSVRSHLGSHPAWVSENIGYLLFLELGDACELLRIGILPEKRKKGEAEKILQSLCDSYSEVLLEVSNTNSPALALYRKLGFVEVGRRKSYYSPGEDAILMKRSGIISA